jgi:hypothetical protein
MTRRDYIFLAECFAVSLATAGMTLNQRRGVAQAARDMAYRLALNNPRFDQVLFLRNCGLPNAAALVVDGSPSYAGSYGGTD